MIVTIIEPLEYLIGICELVMNEKQPASPICFNADEQIKRELLVSKVKLLELDFSKQEKCETYFKHRHLILSKLFLHFSF